MKYFGIDQSGADTVVEEITEDEAYRIGAVASMTSAQKVRKEWNYPKGNVVDRIMAQFIRDRIPVSYVEKIVACDELLCQFVMYAGIEVSVSTIPERKLWIFDGIIPIEFRDEVNDYEIHLKG